MLFDNLLLPAMTEHLDFLLFRFSVRNMLKIKRAGDDLTESSKKNRRICTDGAETLDLLTSGLPALHLSIHVLLQLYWSTHNCVPSFF